MLFFWAFALQVFTLTTHRLMVAWTNIR